MKIEHLGIAVKDLQESNRLFERLLGEKHYKIEEVEKEKVLTSFFRCGETKIELLQATAKESTLSKFIDKRKEGIHHVAFTVDDLDSEIKRLKREGFSFLNEIPQNGADDKLIVFLHPKTTNGVLVELCQEKKL